MNLKSLRSLIPTRWPSLRSLGLAALIGAALPPAQGHNLDTTSTSLVFAPNYVQQMSARASASQPMIQKGDRFWILLKTTPGPGTTTGVGGYQTYYVPQGTIIRDAAYVTPDSSDPRGFRSIPIKGQSPIAIGSGPQAVQTTASLIGFEYSETNGLGVKHSPVTATGAHRGTVAGVYADTGIFYSTSASTRFNSYGVTDPLGAILPMKNNSGDTVGEYYAANIADSTARRILGVMTEWDSHQLRGFGRRDLAPLIDPNGRGNSPWGMGSAVAGPQSGYAWSFNFDKFTAASGDLKQSFEVGPWKRLKYPGSQIASDQPGLISSVIGNAGVDASNLGVATTSIYNQPVTAVRFAIGQLELGRPEYSAVEVEITAEQEVSDCWIMSADAFSGDAGGPDGGMDHIWRYFDPTVVSLNPCTFLQKIPSKDIVAPGEIFYYDITFANTGNLTLPNVTIVDTLPSGITHVSAAPVFNSVSGATYTWNLGTVSAGQFISIRHYVKATGSGTLFNTATITSDGKPIGVAQASVDVGSFALLNKSKSVTPGVVSPPATVTYTIEVSNSGTATNATPLTIRESLPAGFTFKSITSATVNGASIAGTSAFTVNASNPSSPVFTVGQGILAGNKLVVRFEANVTTAAAPGANYNYFSVEYGTKILSGIPEAPVIVGNAQIGDTVFRDWNGDGIQDPGEEGIPGVTVKLYAADGTTELGSTTTDANGQYLFIGLSPATYVVAVKSGLPADHTLTGDPDSTLDGRHTVILGINEAYLTADFGYQPEGTSSIGDLVFADLNGDGIQEAGENGIPNVTINLYEDTNGNGAIDAEDVLIATTSTNASGLYSFTGLAAGLDYIAAVDTSDSDLASAFAPDTFAATTPVTHAVANLSGAYTAADFGFLPNLPSSIGDTVFIDANADGIYDAGTDAPLANISVTLYRDSNGDGIADGPALATAVTDSEGKYLFDGLAPDTYLVVVDATDPDLPSGLSSSVPSYTIVLPANTEYLDADFPFAQLLTKSVDKASVDPSGSESQRTLTYTLTPQIPGDGVLSGLIISDDIPADTTYVTDSLSPASNGVYINDVVNDPPVRVEWDLGSTTLAAPASLYQGIPSTTSATTGQDTYVDEQNKTTSYGSVATFAVGAQRGNRDYGLVQFTLPTLPAGSIINNATLKLRKSGGDTKSALLSVHPVTAAWSAGTVNWNTQPAHEATATASTSVSSNASYSWNVTSLAQRWYSGSLANNGVKIIASKEKAKTFASFEESNASNRPVLEISYYTPGSQGATVNLSTSPALLTGGGEHTITVTMTAEVAQNLAAGILTAPASLTTQLNSTGGTLTKLSGPTPATANIPIGGGTATFTYTYRLKNADVNGGEVIFSGSPTSDGTGFPAAFPTTAQIPTGALSDSVLTAMPMTFQVVVSSTTTKTVIPNTGQLDLNGERTPSNEVNTATKGTIGDFVWLDLDGDGVQDSGEPGLAGVTVFIDANNNGTLDDGELFDVTDQFGAYKIFGLDAGTYNVVCLTSTVPANHLATVPTSLSVTLTAGQQYTTADFGFLPPADGSIGDYLWIDADNDGVQDDGELPLAGIKVTLEQNVNGTWVTLGTATTDASGLYQFTGLAAGDFRVTVDTTSTVTSPYSAGSFTLGSVMTPTSDRDGTGTPHIALVTLTSSGTSVSSASDVDFGYNWVGTIGDYVWWDTDADGTPDAGEDPAQGAQVRLYVDVDGDGILNLAAGDYEIDRRETNASGAYSFANLPPGNYIVDVYEDSLVTDGVRNIVPTTADTIAVRLDSSDMSFLEADFGYTEAARVEALVFYDRNGNGVLETEDILAGIEVELLDSEGNIVATGTTTSEGYISFIVPPGDYSIRYTTSDVPSLYGNRTTPTSFNFTATAGEDGISRFAFGVDTNGTIGDTIFADLDGTTGAGQSNGEDDAGLAGITVYLYFDADGDGLNLELVAATATDATGYYEFSGLEDTTGSARYVVQVATSTLPADYAKTASSYPTSGIPATSSVSLTLTDGGTNRTADFGYSFAPAGNVLSLSGTIYQDDGTGAGTSGNGAQDGTEPGLQGVTVRIAVTFNGETLVYEVTTDSNGFYTFSAIPEGADVTVTVVSSTLPSSALAQTGDPDGGTLSQTWSIPSMSADANDLDFGYEPQFSSIAGTIVIGNGNGIADEGEETLEGIEVSLVWAGPDGILLTDDDTTVSTTTDENGDYTFSGLVPGLYDVTYTAPAPPLSPLADRDGSNPLYITVTLGLNEDKTGQDFELTSPITLGNLVWSDTNNNGVKDAGEAGIPGVTVELYNSTQTPGTDAPLATTTTDADGLYSFSDLAAGTYIVYIPASNFGVTSALADWQNSSTVTSDEDGVDDDDNGIQSAAGAAVVSSAVTLSLAETDNTIDFGFVPNTSLGSISGTVFSDTDNDGDGDEPMSDVTITLYTDPNGDGDPSDGEAYGDPVTTGADGTYSFTSLPPGSYVVVQTTPDGFQLVLDGDTTDSGDDTANGDTADGNIPVTLTAGEDDTGNDFVNVELASIGDDVWWDLNGDGVRDPSEFPISGATVFIDLNNNGKLDDGEPSAVTDAEGNYLIEGLAPGTYTVCITGLPTSATASYDLDGGDDNKASVTLTSGQERTDVDFGYAGNSSIGDYVWNDADGDGNQDTNELPIKGVTLFLDLDEDGVKDDGEPTATTDADGAYLFPGLPPGEYIVVVVKEGIIADATQTGDPDATVDNKTTVTLGAGDDHETADFGYQGLLSIGDFVWNDLDGDGEQDSGEPGLQDIIVFIDTDGDGERGTHEPFARTDADGAYSIAGLLPGTYAVKLDPDTIPASATVTGDPDTDIDGVTSVTLTDESVDTVDFGLNTPSTSASIAGILWVDLNGDGKIDEGEPLLKDVVVFLDLNEDGDYDEGTDQRITTNADGEYSFGDLPPGTYTICVDQETLPGGASATYDKDSGTTNPDQKIEVTVAGGDIVSSLDFGYRGTGTIGDYVWVDTDGDGDQDDTERPLSGVRVYLDLDDDENWDAESEPSAVTDSDGAYSITNLFHGTYTVRVDTKTKPSGSTITGDPDATKDGVHEVTLNEANPSADDVDFGFQGNSSIGDTVWYDLDGDGSLDPGENVLDGVTLFLDFDEDGVLDDNEPSVITDEDGLYSFSGLLAGEYIVRVDTSSLPAGLEQTYDKDGIVTADATTVDLPEATALNDVDFGYRGTATVAGCLYIDANGNGTRDEGEVGLADVDVLVTDSNGFVHRVTTGSDGKWTADVPPGKTLPAVDLTDPDIPEGYQRTEGDDVTELDAEAGKTVNDENDGFFFPSSISGKVQVDTDGDGDADEPRSGVTITLYTDAGDGEPGTVVATKTTGADGSYRFNEVPPGNYVVVQTLPAGYLLVKDGDSTDGDDDTVATNDPTDSRIPVTVAASESDTGNDFLIRTECPTSWAEWQALNPLDGNNGSTANPDGDRWSNLQEFVYCLDPVSGVAECPIQLVFNQDGTIDACVRTVKDARGVTYRLEYIADLNASLPNGGNWTDSGLTPVLTDNGDGSMTACFENLESLLSGGQGFVRSVVEVDTDDDANTAPVVIRSNVEGWMDQTLGVNCETICLPFDACPVFTGVAGSINVPPADPAGAAPSVDVAAAIGTNTLASLWEDGRSYYLDILSGPYEGHRFEVDTIASTDASLVIASSPRNTLPTLPDITGASIAVRAYKTLAEQFPPADYSVASDTNDADYVLIFENGNWVTYYLLDVSGTPIWVNAKTGTTDRGGEVLDPGAGMFVHRQVSPLFQTQSGSVREAKFARPLALGYTFIPNPWPVAASIADRALVNTSTASATAFNGATTMGLADQVMLWRADTTAGQFSYDARFYLKAGARNYYTQAGSSSLININDDLLFKPLRSQKLHMKSDHADYVMPVPWTP